MILTTLQDTVFENIQSSNGLFVKHFHDTYTIGITHEGSFKSVSSHKALHSYKYSTRIINPGDIHCGNSNSWKYTNVYPRIKLFVDLYEQMYYERKVPVFETHVLEDKNLYCKLYAFFESVFQKSDKMKIETELIDAFSYLIKNHSSCTRECKVSFDDDKIILRSLEYICDSLDRQILLDDLAKNSQISKYHFLRIFKKYIGMTPHNYILTQRINRAKDAILHGKSLSNSAYNAGFSDQSHFTRSFKKVYGYLPKELLDKSNFILYK
jgi:AraC-like DNA-binding protein